MIKNLGVMQGRLSPILNGLIQSFPQDTWEQEFALLRKLKLNLLEWTLDQKDLYKNPIMHKEGQNKIKYLQNYNNIKIESLTGDCFMQEPFWKFDDEDSQNRKNDFKSIVVACSKLGISMIIIPLVDNGSIKSKDQQSKFIEFMNENEIFFIKNSIRIIFESDFGPQELALFMENFSKNVFGINYDTGNSASMNFNIAEEFNCYGNLIVNVHLKDRLINGPTVKFGSGNTDFLSVFKFLSEIEYNGNLIIQGARSDDGKHYEILNEYIYFLKTKMEKSNYD